MKHLIPADLRMAAAFLHLRSVRFSRSRETHQWLVLWDIWRATLAFRVLGLAKTLGSGGFQGFAQQYLGPKSILLSAAILSVLIASQLGLQLAEPFPAIPFARYSTRRVWFLRWVGFSALTPIVGVVLGSFGLALGATGILIGLLMYATSLICHRYPIVNLLFGLVAVTLLVSSASFSLAIGTYAGLLAVVLVYAYRDQSTPRYARPLSLGDEFDLELRKELSAFSYFQSDQVQLLLFAGATFACFWMVIGPDTNVHGLSGLAWGLPLFSILPFVRVIFNLFGTDLDALGFYQRYPERTIRYGIGKVRQYRIASYVIALLAVIRVYYIGDWTATVSVVLGSVVVIELVGIAGILMSIRMAERKTVAFSFTANALSGSPKLATLVFGCVAVLTAITESLAGIVGLGMLALCVLAGSGYFGLRAPTSVRFHRMLRGING